MVKPGFFDPVELLRQKQLAREKDDEDLREGRVKREDLRLRNGLFSGVDLSHAKVRIPGKTNRLRRRPDDADRD